jgi:hypothetical protein
VGIGDPAANLLGVAPAVAVAADRLRTPGRLDHYVAKEQPGIDADRGDLVDRDGLVEVTEEAGREEIERSRRWTRAGAEPPALGERLPRTAASAGLA